MDSGSYRTFHVWTVSSETFLRVTHSTALQYARLYISADMAVCVYLLPGVLHSSLSHYESCIVTTALHWHSLVAGSQPAIYAWVLRGGHNSYYYYYYSDSEWVSQLGVCSVWFIHIPWGFIKTQIAPRRLSLWLRGSHLGLYTGGTVSLHSIAVNVYIILQGIQTHHRHGTHWLSEITYRPKTAKSRKITNSLKPNIDWKNINAMYIAPTYRRILGWIYTENQIERSIRIGEL